MLTLRSSARARARVRSIRCIRSIRSIRSVRSVRIIAPAVALAAGLAIPAVPAAAITTTVPEKGVWQVNGLVRATLETADAIYLGGQFTAVTGPHGESVPRKNFAALDRVTGAPLPIQPDPNRPVWAIAASADHSRVYLGGDFQKVAGKNRHRAAAIDAVSGSLLPFNPNLDARVAAIATNGSSVFLGGAFSTVSGAAHAGLAAVDPMSGALSPTFTATTNGEVQAVALSTDGTRLFVGGNFASVSNAGSTSYLASLDPVSGAVSAFPIRPPAQVRALAVSPTQVAVGVGGFSNVALVYDTNSLVRQWSALTDGDIQAMAFQNGVLYVGGHFTEYGGRSGTRHLVAVSAVDGSVLPWKVTTNSALGVFSLTSYDNRLSVGGIFTKINGIARRGYARLDEM